MGQATLPTLPRRSMTPVTQPQSPGRSLLSAPCSLRNGPSLAARPNAALSAGLWSEACLLADARLANRGAIWANHMTKWRAVAMPALSLSPRTIERYGGNILTTLGFRSCAEIARETANGRLPDTGPGPGAKFMPALGQNR